MIRATYDTNTLVSGTISSGSIAIIINAWLQNEIEIVISQPLIDELTRTLTKPYFTSRLTQEQIQKYITLVKERAKMITIHTPIPKMATHPEDDLVLATAESGNADIIVTGDHGLQNLKQYKNIAIVSPKDFITVLHTENKE
jgi:putative PIN family toxin of toxin-antitoxin system